MVLVSTRHCDTQTSECLEEMLDLKDEVIREVLEMERQGNTNNLHRYKEDGTLIDSDENNPDSEIDDSNNDSDYVPANEEDCNNDSDDRPDNEEIDSNNDLDYIHAHENEQDDGDNDSDYIPGDEENDRNIDSDYVPENEEDDSNIDSDLEPDPESENRRLKHSISSKSKNRADKRGKSKSMKGNTGRDGDASDPEREDTIVQGSSSNNEAESADKHRKRGLRRRTTESSHASSEDDGEENDVVIQKSNKRKAKVHFCLYCKKSSTCIRKHYMRKHKEEDSVKTILSLAKGSKERAIELMRLRNSGDYQHNLEVLNSKKETLVSIRSKNRTLVSRHKKDVNVDDYLPCEDCLGFFRKDGLWHHRKMCPLKTDKTNDDDEENDVVIQKSNKRKAKVHFCLYCKKSSTCIRKHYMRKHKEEDSVKTILSLAKGSKERAIELMRLRNSGDYQHNLEVLNSKKETLVSIRSKNRTLVSRHKKDVNVDDYLPCEDCLGFFRKDSLWLHRKTCPLKTNEMKHSKIQESAKFLIPSSAHVNKGMKENVLKRLTNDIVSVCARNDSIIVKIGENMYKKGGQYMSYAICQKMKELARFLIVAKNENTDIKCLSDIIDPEMFQVAVEATRKMCGFNQSTGRLASQSLASRMGQQLKKCARIKKFECLINKSSRREDAEKFLTLMENEWTNNFSSSSVKSVSVRPVSGDKVNRVQKPPSADDIKILTDYLKETAEKCIASLSHVYRKSDWELLNKVTLTRLVLFNNKRNGEAERLKVANYHARKSNSRPMPKIESTLSPVEKMLCTYFARVEMRGKRGRKVVVLLTPEIERCIDILLKYREVAGVSQNNAFVFASVKGTSVNPICKLLCLKTFRTSLNISAGESLTNRNVSKHVAAVAQVLSLNKSDVQVMASILGCGIDISQSSNLQPLTAIQAAKMAKLLLALNSGTIAKYSGLSLDEIPLDEGKSRNVLHSYFNPYPAGTESD